MTILNIQTSTTGLVGVLPSLAYIYTNDPEATVLTAGYLNHEVQQGTSFQMPCLAVVSTRASASAPFQVGTYQVSHSGTDWSLVPAGNPGDVTLPTIANHIATYTNTTGTLSEDPATAISAGNIQAGLSGTAGYLASFPATPLRGSLRLVAVANTGDTLVTLSNVAMGQASVISIPDPANAVGRLLIGATATPFTSGNFPVNSGTAGLMIDSGIPAANLILNSVAGGQTISATTASATPGTIRSIMGSMTESNATMTSGNVVGVRGVVNMVGASGGFQYGTQGKIIATGTLSGSAWTAGLFGQLDISTATVNAGQTAPVWADYGTSSGTITSATGMRMFSGTNTTAATLNAMDYRYGKASALFELAGDGGSYITSGAATPGGDMKKIAITIDGVIHYILAAATWS